MANLICKDGKSLSFAAVNEKCAGMYGIFTIAMTLCAMIFIAGPHTGAAVNPAVALANHEISEKLFKAGTVHDDFRCTYLMGGIVGGICGGFFSMVHGWFINLIKNPAEEPKADPVVTKAITMPKADLEAKEDE